MEILTLIQSMISIKKNECLKKTLEYIPSVVLYNTWNVLLISFIKHLHESQKITTFATIFNK